MTILLIMSRQLAYGSAAFFEDRMAEALARRGHEVIRADYDVDELIMSEDLDSIEELSCRRYDAVLDINSWLPRLSGDSGPWLDSLQAPFFNYIIDHPAYHIGGLSVPLQDETVICIDRTHAAYIREHHPHIKNTYVLPMAGSRALLGRPFAEKKDSVLIPATYEPETERISEFLPEFIREDQRLRNELRLEMALKVAGTGFPTAVMGHGWESTPIADMENVTLLEPREFANGIEAFGRYRYILDTNPLFPCGMHDRVPTAMINGAVCITNMNPAFDPGLVNGVNIIYYNPGLKLPAENAEEISGAAEAYALATCSWDAHARALEEIFMN